MKKLLKITAKLLLAILAIVIVLLLLNPLWLGPAAGIAANSIVPGFTGTDFHVDKVSVNLYTGTLRVEKLRLANPEGFDAEDAFALDLFSVKLSTLSLLSSTIKIQDVTIDKPYASYLSANGTNNFDVIIANVKSHQKEKEKKEKSETKVIIDRLSIAGTRVRLGMMTSPELPTIVLTGLGTSQNGVTFENVGLEILEKVRASLLSFGGAAADAIKSVLGGAAGILGNASESTANALGNIGESTSKLLGNVGEGTKEKLGGIGEGAADGAKKAIDTVSEGTKKAKEALGNLFK